MSDFRLEMEKDNGYRWRLFSEDRPLGQSPGLFPSDASAIVDICLQRAGFVHFKAHIERQGVIFRWCLRIDGRAVAEAVRDATDKRQAKVDLEEFLSAFQDAAIPSPEEPHHPDEPVSDDIPGPTVSRLFDRVKAHVEGPKARQRGVRIDTFRRHRVAMLHGRVSIGASGEMPQPQPDITVRVVGHEEYGNTQTSVDGTYMIAVNGGTFTTLEFGGSGYLAARRSVFTPWEGHAHLPDVVLLSSQGKTSESIPLTRGKITTSSMAVSEISNKKEELSRCARVFFPENVGLSTRGEGQKSADAAGDFAIRIVEFTVGSKGVESMPAPLPASSGYTYAVDLSVTERNEVVFDSPVFHYVENFLEFPVGSSVPSGYFDPEHNAWISSENGRVIAIIGLKNDLALIDVNGKGKAASLKSLTELGFTDDERRHLGATYKEGQSLWRVPLRHFSAWDFNWPYGPPADAEAPSNAPPRDAEVEAGFDPPDEECGSFISVQTQVLGQWIPIAGSSFFLCYSSDRVPGRKVPFSLDVPMSGPKPPSSLKSIDLELQVAGRDIEKTFPAAPNQTFRFEWDGRDDEGRLLQGRQPISGRVGYTYNAVYQEVEERENAFAQYSGRATQNQARTEITLWQEWKSSIGIWDARGLRLGGWSLDCHHVYDPVGRVLYCGNGRRRSIDTALGAASVSALVSTDDAMVKIESLNPCGVAVSSIGAVYLSSGSDILKVEGTKVTAFHQYPPILNNGIIKGLAVGPDGAVYAADAGFNSIIRVAPDGVWTVVAGAFEVQLEVKFGGDGGPATSSLLSSPSSVTIASDGTLYIADTGNHLVRRVTIDGIITSVAGNRSDETSGDGGPATKAGVPSPNDIAVARDGSLYIAQDNGVVRRVTSDGTISTILGAPSSDEVATSNSSFPAGPARNLNPKCIRGIAIAPDDSLVLSVMLDDGDHIVRITPGGMVESLAGGGSRHATAKPKPADETIFGYLDKLDVAPDGTIFATEGHSSENRDCFIAQIEPPFEARSLGEVVIPSEDATELYVFDSSGRHLRTLDARSGATSISFEYDKYGLLSAAISGGTAVLKVERESSGLVTLIAGDAVRTRLEIGAEGLLTRAVTDGHVPFVCAYGPGGLLETFTNSNGLRTQYHYDAKGRLEHSLSADGSEIRLTRHSTAHGYEVKLLKQGTSRLPEQVYEVERASDGSIIRRSRLREHMRVDSHRLDGVRESKQPDGTVTVVATQPDPRFSMYVPLMKRSEIRTPSGSSLRVELTRTIDGHSSYRDRLQIEDLFYVSEFDAVKRTLSIGVPKDTDSTALHENEVLIRTQLDASNRRIAVTAKGQPLQRWSYDQAGRPIEYIRESSPPAKTRVTYDERGSVTSVIDPAGTTTQFSFDSGTQTAKVIFPGGSVLGMRLDAYGRPLEVRTPTGGVHRVEYMPNGQPLRYAPPVIGDAKADRGIAWTYDNAGQLLKIEYAGTSVESEYDEAGRVVRVEGMGQTITFGRDPATGQLLRVSSASGATVDYQRDGFLCTQATTTGPFKAAVKRTFSNGFRLTTEDVGLKSLDYEYGEFGLLTQVGDLGVSYDSVRRVSRLECGSTSVKRDYDAAGRLARQALADSLDMKFTRDLRDRIVERHDTFDGKRSTIRFAYDEMGRLTRESRGDLTLEYSYDAGGNRIGVRDGARTASATYDAQDRLLTYGDLSFAYDDSGGLKEKRRKSGPAQRFEFELHGALRSATTLAGKTVEYVNDGFGRRVAELVDGTMTRGLLYHMSASPVAEVDAAGRVFGHFVYASHVHVPDIIIRRRATFLIVKDPIGSPRLIVDVATGEVAQRLEYDAFGRVLEDTKPGFQPFGFAGGLYDARTGLTRFGLREYDAEVGRWTSKDPLLLSGGDSNLYAYCGNDPVNRFDPVGLMAECDWSVQPYNDAALAHFLYCGGKDAEIPPEVLDQILELTKTGYTAGPTGFEPPPPDKDRIGWNARINAWYPYIWLAYPDVSAGMGGWYYRRNLNPGHDGHMEIWDNYNFGADYNKGFSWIPGTPYNRSACWTCHCKKKRRPPCVRPKWEKPMP